MPFESKVVMEAGGVVFLDEKGQVGGAGGSNFGGRFRCDLKVSFVLVRGQGMLGQWECLREGICN